MGFHHGEEVLLDDERFVIAGIEGDRYRLLATSASGTRIRYANAAQLHKMDAYTRPHDDTDHFVRNR